MMKSRFEKNKDMIINLELQVYSGDIYMLSQNDKLKEFQGQRGTFTLKVINGRTQYFSDKEYEGDFRHRVRCTVYYNDYWRRQMDRS